MLVFAEESSFQGFLGGAGFRPSTVGPFGGPKVHPRSKSFLFFFREGLFGMRKVAVSFLELVVLSSCHLLLPTCLGVTSLS